MNKTIFKMSKKDFEDFKKESKNVNLENIKCFNSIVIIPKNELHDSGFCTMDFALTLKDIPIAYLSTYSDVINLDGIGGYGHYINQQHYQNAVVNGILSKGWRIDCLPCGYLRLFSRYPLSIDNFFGSDFSVYSEEEGLIYE